MKIEFSVPAIPVSQPRQRHRIAGSPGKQFVHNYTPADHPVQNFKASVRMAFRQAYQGAPVEGSIFMKIEAVFPRPARLIWKKRQMPRDKLLSKPDIDNVAKSVFDALNGIAYRDDSQIYNLWIIKVIAAGDEQPHVRILIEHNEQGSEGG